MVEYDRILHKMNYYMKNNKEFTINMMKEFANSYLKYHSININLKFIPNYEYNFVTYPHANKKYYELYFSNKLLDEKIENNNGKIDNCFTNLLKLYYCLHELTHVEQFYMQNNNTPLFNNTINDEVLKCIKARYIADELGFEELYEEYHDRFILEYYADIRALINLEKIYTKYFKLDDITIEIFNFYAANTIYYAYTVENSISYPLLNNTAIYEYVVDKLNCKIEKIEINKILENYEFKEKNVVQKLKLGFPISKDEYHFFENIKNNKVLTKNLFSR